MGIKGLSCISNFLVLSEYHRTIIGLFLVLFVIGIIFLWKTDRSKALLIVGLLAIPILVSTYLAETMPMDARYLIYLLPFFFLGISLSLKPLAEL